jgi:hypothetical protein
METPTNSQRPADTGVPSSSDWFDVLDAAGNALQNVQHPLRAMELPEYPAGGVCGCHKLAVALDHIVKAQEALRDMERQLGEWSAMNATAYGRPSNTEVRSG